MRKIVFVFSLIMASCAPPKEVIKSKNVTPFCHCEGQGKYTVVMDAGMGNWSLFYQPLFQVLKSDNKICVIDRAGYGMDSITVRSRDLPTIASELRDVLQETGVNKNIILVGHSLGGLHVRQYYGLYPENVKGIVLIDAAHSDQFQRLPKQFYEILKEQPKQLEAVIDIAKRGYLKYSKGKIPTFGLPKELLNSYYEVTTSPEYYATMKMEVEYFEENLKIANSLNSVDALPLLVIGSRNSMDHEILPVDNKDYPYDEHNKTWLALQEELAGLSTNSIFLISDHNHYLMISDYKFVQTSINSWIREKVEPEY